MVAPAEVAPLRLRSQRLVGKRPRSAAEAVYWLGAVQSQEFGAACWALAQRVPHTTLASLRAAFDKGSILRTHVLRPTWHFVAPQDIRWLLMLTAPRVRAVLAYYDGQLGVDGELRTKSRKVIVRALKGGRALTRAEIGAAHQGVGITASGPLLGHLILHAEQDALVCSGPLQGKQFTYALLDERVPATPALARDEALHALAQRYFASHGPASVADFAWWSGLTMTDCRNALGAAEGLQTDGSLWWRPARAERPPGPHVHLLPNYDELTVAYKDRSATVTEDFQRRRPGWVLPSLANMVTVDGRAVGGWKRTATKTAVAVAVKALRKLTRPERDALEQRVAAYGAFHQMPATLTLVQP